MIWSICDCLDEDGKKKIDAYIRELEDIFPVKDTIYHYYVDNTYYKFKHWEEKLLMNKWKYNTEYIQSKYNLKLYMIMKLISIFRIHFSEIIVPTINTIRHDYLIQLYLSKKQPILLAGPKGCGKTLNVKNAYKSMNKNRFSFLTINMTAQTTSNDVQETIEEKLEKRTKELYIPLAGIFQ